MKKRFLIILIAIILVPIKVFASGGFGVSTSSISMYVGESRTVNVTSNNSVGKLNISTSNGGVASINASSIFIQTPGSSGSIIISGKQAGTATISVVASSNYATMDEEILSGQTRTITVNVMNRPTTNNNNNNSSNTGTNTNTNNKTNTNNSNTVNTNNENQKSTNNNIKEISVPGYKLEKIDNNNYKLSVSNDKTSITVNATLEDSKSNITGTGSHSLNIGENIIELVVTSESGNQNKVKLIITRKDSYYLDDLKEILNSTKDSEINIKINKDSKLTKKELKQIKEKGKVIKFNYYDENKILKFSWTIDGSKIKEMKEIEFEILNNTNNSKKISELANYATGMYLNFKYEGKLPKGTKVKYFVGDNYNDGDVINLYYYNNKKNRLEITKEGLKVKNGYVEFELEHCSDYFISMTNINKTSNNKLNIYKVISIIELIIIVGFVGLYVIKIKSIKSNKEELNNKIIYYDK